MKEFAANNFKFDENGRKFSERVENNMVKGKLLVTSKVSFCHSVFERLAMQISKSQGLVGKGLNHLPEKEIF